MKLGEILGVDSTPALFINGEKMEGALPMEYVYRDDRQCADCLRPDAAATAADRTHSGPAANPTCDQTRELTDECRRFMRGIAELC